MREPVILTRLLTDPDHPAARWDMYRVHQHLAALLDGEPRRVLWARPDREAFTIQAPRPLTVTDLPAGYALAAVHTDLGPTLAAATPGQPVTIRVVVNPARSIQTGQVGANGRPRGTIQPIPARERPRWLTERLSDAVHVTELAGRGLGTARATKDGRPVLLAAHRFVVAGTVTDPSAFARRVRAGLGRGKAFGFGLLDVALGPTPAAPVPTAPCPACSLTLLTGGGPVECPRCYAGVTVNGALGGFAAEALGWWRRLIRTQCVGKYGHVDAADAQRMLARKEAEAPWGGVGEASCWRCVFCGLWHWGHTEPGAPVPTARAGEVFAGYAKRERDRYWWTMRDGRTLPAHMVHGHSREKSRVGR